VSKTATIPEPLAPLAYAAPTHARPRVALYRIAQACWILPLVVGVGSLMLFAVTRARAATVIGFFTVVGGAALFGVGVICLIVFWCLLRRCADDERRAWSRRASILLGLLVLNFPIAAGCAGSAIWLMSRFTVVVVNETGEPLRDVRITVPGHAINLATLQPGERVTRSVSLSGDGGLEFSAVRGGALVTGEADAYLDSMHGEARTGIVTFAPSGATAAVVPG
jgi:hypothetical protein